MLAVNCAGFSNHTVQDSVAATHVYNNSQTNPGGFFSSGVPKRFHLDNRCSEFIPSSRSPQQDSTTWNVTVCTPDVLPDATPTGTVHSVESNPKPSEWQVGKIPPSDHFNERQEKLVQRRSHFTTKKVWKLTLRQSLRTSVRTRSEPRTTYQLTELLPDNSAHDGISIFKSNFVLSVSFESYTNIYLRESQTPENCQVWESGRPCS